MGYRSRRRSNGLRDYMSNSRNCQNLNFLSNEEKNLLILYAFYISMSIYNEEIDSESSFFRFLLNFAKSDGSVKRFETVIDSYKNFLISDNRFTPVKTEENDKLTNYLNESESNFNLFFDNNEKNNAKFNELYQTFQQCLYSEEKQTFSKILYLTFIYPEENFNSILEEDNFEIPEKFQTLNDDISVVEFLKTQLSLSDEEAKILKTLYFYNTLPFLGTLTNDFEENKLENISRISGLSKHEIERFLLPDQKLRQYGFINVAKELNSDLFECISNKNLDLYFADLITVCDCSKTYSLDSFHVEEKETNLILELLEGKNPVSILFYGQPGSGKTEYAKALAGKTGKKVIIFKNETEIESRKPFLSKLNCLLSLNRPDTILIVDEADSVLQTNTDKFFGRFSTNGSKGFVNKMLENSKNKVLWIVNYIDQMDSSTRRRFTMSCRFESMPADFIKGITKSKLEKTNLPSEVQEKILNLMNNYRITGSSVDNVIKAIDSINEPDNEKLLEKLKILLKENALLLDSSSTMRKNVSSAYDYSILNTSISAEKIVKMVNNAVQFSIKNQSNYDCRKGIRMLFYGLSGTGKTEFARYISQSLQKDILVRRPSDILDKYVGGTENKIARAFAEAAANDQILLFDEADTFFSDRENAEHTWERSQVNEFLTQLEEFPGILICTTNLRNIMDPAMLRRFHITVEFKSLEKEGIKKLLSGYFSSFNFSNSQIEEINRYHSCTPGDFSRLSDTIRFLDEKEISSESIVDGLCKIQEEKCEGKSVIGFGY